VGQISVAFPPCHHRFLEGILEGGACKLGVLLYQAIHAVGRRTQRTGQDDVGIAIIQFASYYTRKNISVSYVRAREKNNLASVKALYGNTASRYW